MWVMDMAGVTFTEGDQVRPTSKLFGRPLVGKAHGQNRPFPGLSEVAVLGSPHFPGEMWPAEESPYHTGRFCLTSVLVGLGAPVANVVSEVPLADKFFDFILEYNGFFSGVANVLVIPAVLTLVSLQAVSPHRVGSFVDSCMLSGQEYFLTRPRQVGEVIVFARMGSGDPLIWAFGLLLVSVRRSSAIFVLMLSVIPALIHGLGLSCWADLLGYSRRS